PSFSPNPPPTPAAYPLPLHDALPILVEPWSFVAAGTLIPPNKVVRSGEMVMGNPFRVVRTLTPKDREWIEYAWTVYVKRAKEYIDRKSTRLNSSHVKISYAVFCLKKK